MTQEERKLYHIKILHRWLPQMKRVDPRHQSRIIYPVELSTYLRSQSPTLCIRDAARFDISGELVGEL